MLEPAPFWRRLLARIIDLALALPLTFLMIVPLVVVLIPLWLVGDDRQDDTVSSVGAVGAYVLAYVCLEWVLLVRRDGQTLGKGLMGLRVVRRDAAAEVVALAWFPALVRLLVLLAPLAFLSGAGSDDGPDDAWDILAYVGVFSFLLSAILALVLRERRSAVHDLLAGSRVVRAPRRGIALREDLRMAVSPRSPVTLAKDIGLSD